MASIVATHNGRSARLTTTADRKPDRSCTTSPNLRVEHRHVSPGLDVCTPVGEIDLATAPLLRRALVDCDGRRVPRVVVDLTRVSFLGVAGVRVLLTAAEQARPQRWRISLVVAGRAVVRALEATGCRGRFTTYRWLSEALTAEKGRISAHWEEVPAL